MKRTMMVLVALVMSLALCACTPNAFSYAEIESSPVDEDRMLNVVPLAREELEKCLSEHTNLAIKSSAAGARTDDENQIVVEFTYTSDQGDGVYGLLYERSDSGEFTLVRHGEKVTMDSLLN